MLDLVAIRDALATQLGERLNMPGLTVTAHMPESPVPPCIAIIPPIDGDYYDPWRSFGSSGVADLLLTIEVLLPAGHDADAQRALDRLLSIGVDDRTSIFDAVMADRTLSGTVADATPRGPRWGGRVQLAPDTQTYAYQASIPVEIVVHKR